jgi:hypothetical protein
MRKLSGLLFVALIFANAPRALANHDQPIIIDGGSAIAETHSSRDLPDNSPSFAAAVAVQVIAALIQAGVIH